MVNTLFNKLPGDKEQYVFYFKKKKLKEFFGQSIF